MSSSSLAFSLLLLQGLLSQAFKVQQQARQPIDINLKKTSGANRVSLRTIKEAVAANIPAYQPPALTRREDVTGTFAGSGFTLNQTCGMSESNACPISSMKRGQPTLVFPGGKTRCIFGSPFAFQVWPGNSEKLLIYLEGGGACWDDVTTVFKALCKSFVWPTDVMGFFNKCPGEENPFSDYTVVFIEACSGDLHSGSVVRPWDNPQSDKPIEQRGLENVRAAVDWVKANLPNKFKELALAGESAGAIGVQIWAAALLKELEYESASVLADSYVGVFPPGFQGPVFKALNVCDSGLLNEELRNRCSNEELTIADVYESTMKEFPHVAFGNLNSKHDQGQIMFYNLASVTVQMENVAKFCNAQGEDECDMSQAPTELLLPRPPIAYQSFHEQLDDIVDRYSAQPNYASYIMSASMHTITPYVYGECPMIDYGSVGFWEGGEGAQRRDLREWIKAYFFKHDSLRSGCERRLSQDEDDYCHQVQENKVLTL